MRLLPAMNLRGIVATQNRCNKQIAARIIEACNLHGCPRQALVDKISSALMMRARV
jgi:hypothetical protein